jgi:hypothetical protein
MSLLNAAQAPVKVANDKTINYLVTLLEERSEEPIERDQFVGMPQLDVSDLITLTLTRPALPATEEQLAEVARLSKRLGRGTLVTKDRGQASRQIRAMRADITAIETAAKKRALTGERSEAANSLLDSILGAAPAPVVVANDEPGEDDIPF